MRVIEFWTVVRRTIVMEMRTFIETRDEMLKLDELQSEMLDNGQDLNYTIE